MTAVSDPAGNSVYSVSFNRSLVNCVVQAIAGAGDPQGAPAALAAGGVPSVEMSEAIHDDAIVRFNTSIGSVDTSFLITAFC